MTRRPKRSKKVAELTRRARPRGAAGRSHPRRNIFIARQKRPRRILVLYTVFSMQFLAPDQGGRR